MGHEHGAAKPRALTYAPVDNWISIASAAISVLGAIVAGVMTTWSNKNSRRFEAALQRQEHEQSKAEQAAQLLSRYREPLLLSANSLQSRIFNVLREDYLPIYLHCGDSEQELYVPPRLPDLPGVQPPPR
jgi:hypothetical protein